MGKATRRPEGLYAVGDQATTGMSLTRVACSPRALGAVMGLVGSNELTRPMLDTPTCRCAFPGRDLRNLPAYWICTLARPFPSACFPCFALLPRGPLVVHVRMGPRATDTPLRALLLSKLFCLQGLFFLAGWYGVARLHTSIASIAALRVWRSGRSIARSSR